MDIISMTREMGKLLQQDERYIKFRSAEKANDEDKELQVMIEKFNNLRTEVNAEISKTERDEEKVNVLNNEFQTLYKNIVERPNMVAYTEAKTELDKLLNFINQIIGGSVNGENPDEIEEQAACSGNCSGCSGCH